MIYTIEDFSKKYNISNQAKMSIYMHLVLAIFLFFYTFNKTSNVAHTMIALIIYIGFGSLGVYAINCLSKGKCDTYAWVVIVVQSLNFLFAISKIK